MVDREHRGVFVQETSLRAPVIRPADTTTTGFVGEFEAGPFLEPTNVSSPSRFLDRFTSGEGSGAGHMTETAVAVLDFFAAGGRRAVVSRVRAASGAATVDELLAGLAALTAAGSSASSSVRVVAMPDMARRNGPFSAADYARLVRSADGFCADNRQFLLVDPNTAGDSLEDIQDWLTVVQGWGSPDSAIYFPRLQTTAAADAGFDGVPASGAVAGVMARTDVRRGVWKAPAGVEATIECDVLGHLSDCEQSPLNRQGVNVIRSFPGRGTVVWGSRTSGGSVGDPYRHVQVRRTALFLEHSLIHGLRWTASWSNDAELWREVRLSVENFMLDLWRAGAFVGDRPEDAFFVRCDKTTMTRVDIRRGRVIVQLGFAPIRPAEFVLLAVTAGR